MQNKKPMLHIAKIDYLNISKQINEEDSVLYYEKDGFILTIYYLFKIEGYRETIISTEQEASLKHHEILEYMM